jgi:hypothetical protein
MGRLPKVGERENRNTGGEEIDMSRVVDMSCPPTPATCGRRGVEVSRFIKAGGCVEVEVWYWVEPKVERVTIFAVRRSQKRVDWLFEDYQILEVNFAPFDKVRLESGAWAQDTGDNLPHWYSPFAPSPHDRCPPAKTVFGWRVSQ